jgi:hypothetical protein
MEQKEKELRIQLDTAQMIKSEINLAYNKCCPEKFETDINYVLVGIAVLTGLLFLSMAKSQNGYFCFPLDYLWIHLTFAKNIVEFGSFSFYKNQLATSGLTSLLYTGVFLYFRRADGKGEEYLNKALSIFPEYADANFMMAQMQLLKKNYVSAKEYNDKCLSIYSNNKDVLDMKETLKNKFDNSALSK